MRFFHCFICCSLTALSLGFRVRVKTETRPEVRQKRSDDPAALQAVVDNLSRQVSDNVAQITALKTQMSKLQTHVAFHAEFNHDPVQVGQSAPFMFDKVVLNAGNGYDVHSGQFRAPVSGSYMIAIHFMGDYHTSTYVYLMVDESTLDYTLSHGDGTTWDHVSASLVIHLRAGQRVWLKNDSRGTKEIKGGHWTTFSGFLIMAD